MQGVSSLAKGVSDCQEGVCSMELVTHTQRRRKNRVSVVSVPQLCFLVKDCFFETAIWEGILSRCKSICPASMTHSSMCVEL
jgi:hypothetical protein